MKKILLMIPCILLGFSFDGGYISEKAKISVAQIGLLQGQKFVQRGISGKGIRIAILDGGFPGVNTHPGFKHLLDHQQIIATWDFVKNCETVYTGMFHGTAVLSCIAGINEGQPLGMAPDAEFLLARTETRGEPLQEEVNWAKAVDWAIDHGAKIIQSSLGYTHQRYFTSELDGRHSIAAKAAARAARLGVLIVNSNGNEGQSRWQTLVTPADADSILSVGAIDPETGLVTSYSSVGPTADKRLKPNVSAPGKVLTLSPNGGTRILNGTSFSAPLISGFAACTWQLYPNLSAQEIITLIEKSANLYPYYDYAHGYGIPQASYILNLVLYKLADQLILSVEKDHFNVQIRDSSVLNPQLAPKQYLYYHICNHAGQIIKYGVYHIYNTQPVLISKSGFEPGAIFRCSFNGEIRVWEEKK